jgi:hypothetical protein
MALDEANHRLFVGTRDPPKLMVFDTNSGKVISILDIAKDPDDISYDAAKKQIYVSCGERFINIFQQQQQQPHQPILLLSIDLVACYYVMVNGISNQKRFFVHYFPVVLHHY